VRKAIVTLFVTAVALVLLLNFKTRPAPLSASSPATATRAASAAQPAASGAPAGGSSGGSSGSSGATSSAGASGTATGDLMQDQYGDVQVRVTLRDGKITDVRTVAIDGVDGHSQQIDAQAEPLLRAEALQARSAQVDVISGATYTSQAYIGSLQSAIDKVRGA
jgi:uncharacterized protein with FMN-binding domain